MNGRKNTFANPLSLLAALAVALASPVTLADADGPDFYVVHGVARNDVLNIRAEPDPHAPKVGDIPPDGECVRNLGCKGGLTFQEFTELSPEQKKQRERENPRWCKVEYRGAIGWVNAHYLREGYCQTGTAATAAQAAADEAGTLAAQRAGVGDFDATGPVPCARYKGQPMGQCQFGVARAGGGTAAVAITHPDGKKRILFFTQGRYLGADTAESDGYHDTSARKDADLSIIHVGPERYEIPDAVIFGG